GRPTIEAYAATMITGTTDPFQTWWNRRYFHTSNPRYEIYKRLFTKGVSLDYVDFLCAMLELRDCMTTKRNQRAPSKTKSQPQLLDNFLEADGGKLAPTMCDFVVDYVLQEIKKLYRPDIADLLNLPPSFISLLVKAGMLTFRVMRLQVISDTAEQKVKESKAEEQAVEQELKAEEWPIYTAMKKLAPGTPKPGNQADPWGSFILLA